MNKVCLKCKQELPIEWFSKNRNQCKNCRAEYNREYNQQNKEAKAEYAREYYQQNKEAKAEYAREYYQQNKEAKAEYYQQNKEAWAEYSREYYQQNKEAKAEYAREYYQRKPEVFRAAELRRRARKKELPHDWTTVHITFMLEYFNHSCIVCGSSDNLACDHFIPLDKDKLFGTVPTNMILLCKSCNSSKSNKLPEEWLQCFEPSEAKRIWETVMIYFEIVNCKL